MKIPVCSLLLLTGCSWSLAEELPTMEDKPWLGVYLGHVGRGFDYSFGTDAKGEVHFKKGKKRENVHNTFPVRYVLEEEMGGKWVRRQIAEDGFTYDHEASAEKDKSTVVATYTGDTKVALTHEFEDGEIRFRGKIVQKTTENPVRFGVEVYVPYTWRNHGGEQPSKRDLRKKLRDSEIRAVRAKDGKKVKYEMWEDLNIGDADHLGEGAKELLVDIERFSGRKVTFEMGNEDQGLFRFQQSGRLYSGFRVTWYPALEHLEKPDCYFRLAVK